MAPSTALLFVLYGVAAVLAPARGAYDRLFLLGAQGAVRMAVPESAAPIASLLARRAVEVLRSGEMVFQDFYRDEHDQRVYLTIATSEVNAPLCSLTVDEKRYRRYDS